MARLRILVRVRGLFLTFLLFVYSSPASGQSLDEIHKQALKEGGTLNFYGTLAQINAEKILPVFEKRFPGIKVNHVDATADKLAARAITEARGGRVIGDVFQGSLENGLQLQQQGLLLEQTLPEAAPYPNDLKGSHWIASNIIYFIGAWNTGLVKKGEEPKGFEDFADPKWKGKLIAEPRDFQLLMGLAKRKYKSDEKAVDLLKKIAGNGVEFHKGHSQLIELLVAGQAPVCLTCYSHHFPPRIKKGAPVLPLLSEGVGEVGGSVAILRGAPHPLAAMLWARWAISEEGQRAYAQAGETPAHPGVEPAEKVRPATTYMLTAEEVKEFPKYEKLWKEIFQLR
jgi:iron(III) transport system substrate-binding protein